jgi:hypothetical protein
MLDRLDRVSNTLISDGLTPEAARTQATAHYAALADSAKLLADQLVAEETETAPAG